MKIKILAILFVALLLAVNAVPVNALAPSLPASFYGNLTINGNPASIGTVVEARGTNILTGIEGNPLTTIAIGVYGSSSGLGQKLVVQGDIADGTTITFYVNNVAATPTAQWHSGAITELDLNVSTTAATNLSLALQGGSRPDAGWAIPLTVKFFTPGSNVMTGTPLLSANVNTTRSGSTAISQITGISPGNYDISVVSDHTLVNVKRNVTITVPSTDVNMGTLLEGNANNDIRINILDFGILSGAFGKVSGDTGYNAMADFDRNGRINIQDFGLLSGNFGKISPIELP
jgi:hypothetical protein